MLLLIPLLGQIQCHVLLEPAFRWGGAGALIIGDGVGISNTAITCQKEVKIGKNVFIGAGCQIFDTDFHPLESQYRYGLGRNDNYTKRDPIIIEDGVFIGTGSIILKGTHIGSGSVIGAGAVVHGNIPQNQIWAGNPARYIKDVE